MCRGEVTHLPMRVGSVLRQGRGTAPARVGSFGSLVLEAVGGPDVGATQASNSAASRVECCPQRLLQREKSMLAQALMVAERRQHRDPFLRGELARPSVGTRFAWGEVVAAGEGVRVGSPGRIATEYLELRSVRRVHRLHRLQQ
jgi:hypothetical protein